MVSLHFDKPRTLQFDVPTFRALENALGGKPMGVIIEHLSQVSLSAFIATLWAGFKHEDPSLTEADVERALVAFIDGGGRLGTIGTALNDALIESGLLRDPDPETAGDDITTITLDKPRQIKYGLRAVRLLEDALGGVGLGGVDLHIRNLGVNTLAVAVWVGLKAEDKNLTLNLTVKLLDTYLKNGGSWKTLGGVVRRAIEQTNLFKNDALDLSGDTEGNPRPEPVTT
jgi:hypothetical protein